jgi:hypothetical protein
MIVNYLRMIWDVKILLAKIKDGKGRDFKFLNKKSLLSTIRPEIPFLGYFLEKAECLILHINIMYGLEAAVGRIFQFFKKR